ncbi:DivIVA domain-containing protein [Agrococcus sp. Ld7]|uniref:DivIVA domain-containing protein n=1 Tax=Agrococcus sp. Ld7 TaxID=649148 RepID=UPI0038641772
MLTAEEVRDARFSGSGMFHAGYDAAEVDHWLALAVFTLLAHQGDAGGDVRLLAEDADEVRFRMHRGAGAYDTGQVDMTIGRIAAALHEHEA